MKAFLLVCWVTVHRGLVLLPELKCINLEIVPQKFISLYNYVGGSRPNLHPKLWCRNIRWGSPWKSLCVWGTKQMWWERAKICSRAELHKLGPSRRFSPQRTSYSSEDSTESGPEILLARIPRDSHLFSRVEKDGEREGYK